jgi:nucleotide sugar dehydrogenase
MDEMVVPLIAQRKDIVTDAQNPTADDAVYLAYCPERVNPGDPKWSVRNIPRVLGGYSKAGITKAKQFYENILEAEVLLMNSATEAEAVKIVENTFRDINIAYINEMAKSFDHLGIDIMNVIRGAATKPFAFLPHYPGAGVGGHCISVDPYYMIERARGVGFDHQFLKLARHINESMPQYTVERLLKGLAQLNINPKQATVALLGLAYKKDVADIRESPAFDIHRLLEEHGLKIRVYDPFVPEQSTVATLAEAIHGVPGVVVATAHSEFVRELTAPVLTAANVSVVVDGRNCLSADDLAQAGIFYLGIGLSRAPHAATIPSLQSHSR